MKKATFTVILLIFGMLHGYSQFMFNDLYNPASRFVTENTTDNSPKVRIGMSSTYFNTSYGASVFGTNISPSVSFKLKPKLHLVTGMSYQTYFVNTNKSVVEEANQFNHATNISVGTIYISGIYELNSKTTIRSTAWKQFDLSSPKTTLNPRATNFEAEGINVGINYKVNDHFQIDASFDYSNGYNPYRSAYQRFGNYSSSPFGGF